MPLCKLQWLLHRGRWWWWLVECCFCIPYRLALMLILPDLCTFFPDLCALRPDLCTLRFWCYPSINQHKYYTCTHGGRHWLQLALVAFFLQPLAQTLLAPVVVPPVATCIGGLLTIEVVETCNIIKWDSVHIDLNSSSSIIYTTVSGTVACRQGGGQEDMMKVFFRWWTGLYRSYGRPLWPKRLE